MDGAARPAAASGSVASALGIVRGLRPTLFRGPTDNDRGGHPSDASVWADARLALLEHRLAAESQGRLVWVSGVPSRQRRLTTTLDWRPAGTGLRVAAGFEFEGDWPTLPRVGLTVPLPASEWGDARVAWTGLGPAENYPDLDSGAWLGRFAAGIDELWGPQIRPQESGHRGGVRELVIEGSAGRLLVRSDAPRGRPGADDGSAEAGFGFSLCRWTPRQLDAAAHVEELPASGVWWLTLDARHAGIGTASCGPGVDPRFVVHPVTTRLAFEVGLSRP